MLPAWLGRNLDHSYLPSRLTQAGGTVHFSAARLAEFKSLEELMKLLRLSLVDVLMPRP